MNASRSVILFGTDEKVETPPVVRAGPLEAVLEAGNLRYIRIAGQEALRAIAFLVRDRNWGTYNPKISNLVIDQQSDRFSVTYDALCSDEQQSFRYSARIEGQPDGNLLFEADGEALTDFVTNRTGFVVLHALEGVVGAAVTVEHTDGKTAHSRFPERVDPTCPFQDIRALTHELSPGVSVTCRMEGDAFEMEDHRNWMDASYKTYVRPLALPWPYTIEQGQKSPQSVSLSIDGAIGEPAGDAGTAPVSVSVGDRIGHGMPRIGLAVPAEVAGEAVGGAGLITSAGPSFLVCHFDARKGHGVAEMQRFGEIGAATGVELVLEVVLPCLDEAGEPSADLAILNRDLKLVSDAAQAAGISFARVAVSPSSDLKCTLPGSVFPDAPGWDDLMAAARKAFPDAQVGGGMFSYFTELNRKRPPSEAIDFICHSGCPIVHAGDDISVTETLESLPSIFASVRAFGGGKPYWVFPTAVSMRDNPYGAVPAENPDNIRQAMNRVDPRDRGLLGAAWYAGYLAHAARAGVDAVTLAAVAGPSGIIYSKQQHEQPWFDDAGVPVLAKYHVLAGHAALSGDVMETRISDGRSVQALAVSNGDGLTVWLSNLTGVAQTVTLSGVPGGGRARVLDAASFEAACADPDWTGTSARIGTDGIMLDAYAVAELRFD